jgi:hypothetical protein
MISMRKPKPTLTFDSATLEMFVLDVLRHDEIEQLSSIVRLMNDRTCVGWRDFWPHDFTTDEILATVKESVERGNIELLREGDAGELAPVPSANIETIEGDSTLWFRLTPSGRSAWERWKPPTEP